MNNESNINDNDRMDFPRNFQNDCGNNFNANLNRLDQQEEEVSVFVSYFLERFFLIMF